MPETSLAPPPPKNHGGGAFIGAVIVMLLAMGGLLFWKFRGKDEPPQVPVVAAERPDRADLRGTAAAAASRRTRRR